MIGRRITLRSRPQGGHIRLAEATDHPALGQVHIRAIESTYRDNLTDHPLDEIDSDLRNQVFAELIADPEVTIFLAERQGEICGFLSLLTNQVPLEISAVWVEPRRWRIGIGRQLVRHALNEAAERGHQDIVAWTLADNDSSIQFWQACSFRLDGTSRHNSLGPVGLTDLPAQLRVYRRV